MLRTTPIVVSTVTAALAVAGPARQAQELPGEPSAPGSAESAESAESARTASAFEGEIAPVPFGGTAAEAVDEARALADRGEAHQARALALTALARSAYDTGAYRVLFDVARAAGDEGEALRWGKWIHLAHDYADRTDQAAAIAEELDAIYAGWNAEREPVRAWRESLRRAADHAAGRGKLYRVAGHVLGRLLSLDPGDEELLEQHEQLFERAGEQATGGAFVAERVRARPAKWIERQNEEHADWDDAFQRTTEHYRVVTNVSYEFFETVCAAMDEMYDFYRDVYGYRRKAPRVTLAIHRKRSDFDRYCQRELGGALPLGVGGWFYDEEMTVAAYDRSEGGGDLADVYRVLFHEASHQFMYLLTEKRHRQSPPTWLNEGTASYFEGCRIKADGTIVKNLPAASRVVEWEYLEGSSRRHDLADLITCPHRAYDGSYYAYGWSLVYFLQNYEDAEGRLVYRDAYHEYLDSYTRKGPREESEFLADALERAKRLFVEEIRDPDVPDWDAFEERWRTWMQGVVRETKAGQAFADELLDRAERRLARGDAERALNAAERADDKRPNDPRALLVLARANEALDDLPAATFWMLRHWEESWARGDEDRAAAAEAWLAEHDAEELVQDYCAASRELVRASAEILGKASADGFPAAGMLARAHVQRALGLRHHAIAADLAALFADGVADLRLWRRAFDKEPEDNRRWDDVDVVRFEPDGVLVNNPHDLDRDRQPIERSSVRELRWLEPPFDVRGSVRMDGKQGALFLLGIDASGLPQLAVSIRPDRTVRVARVEVDAEASADLGWTPLTYFPIAEFRHGNPSEPVPFRIRLEDAGGVLRVGDAEVALPQELTRERLHGTIGVSAGDAAVALFSEVQVRPSFPFWPVDPDLDSDP